MPRTVEQNDNPEPEVVGYLQEAFIYGKWVPNGYAESEAEAEAYLKLGEKNKYGPPFRYTPLIRKPT